MSPRAKHLVLLVLLAFGSIFPTQGAEKKLKFAYLTQTGIDNTFWQTIKRGIDDACKKFDVDCQLIFTQPNGDLQQHLQNLETVINQNVDGIVTVIVDDTLYDDAIKRAIKKGIPVLSANVDDTQGAAGNARLAFVGQNLFQAGYDLAQKLSEKFEKGKPVHVLLCMARPGESWCEQRIGGAKKFLEELKQKNPSWDITYTVIDSGGELSATGQRVCEYVQGHPETNAVIDSGFWVAGAGAGLRDMGIKPNQILIGGFDLVPQVIDEMKAGYFHVTVDQQPYLQGFLPVEELYFIKKYGLSAFDVNTGKKLVTPEDVADLEKYIAAGVR
jgi:simple sugar transport system substrate-binding protein